MDLETLTVLKDINFSTIYLGLKDISPEQAAIFAHFKTRTIHFVAVQELHVEVARELIQTEWLKLHFDSVRWLSADTAELFHQWIEEEIVRAVPRRYRSIPKRQISMASIGDWEKFRLQ